jgi:hypothetical protein
MRQHALDGEMGLAGVGRAKHGGDAASAKRACGLGESPAHLTFLTGWFVSSERGNESRPIADSAHFGLRSNSENAKTVLLSISVKSSSLNLGDYISL